MAFSKYIVGRINHLQCGSSDTSNFALLVSITDPNLRTQANNGFVTNVNGFDICIFSDITLTTQLAHQIISYNPATGQFIARVFISTLSSTVDNLVYIGFGDSGITTSQENIVGVWNANFKGSWQFGNGSTLSVADGTSNANNGTNVGGVTASAGKVDGCAVFNGTAQYVTTPAIALTSGFTVAYWQFKTSSAQTSQVAFGANDTDGFCLRTLTSSGLKYYFTKFGVADIISNIAPTLNVWERVVWTVEADKKPRLYINGVLRFTSTNTSSIISSTHAGSIGAELNAAGTPSNFFGGSIQSVELSNVVWSIDQIIADYNMFNSSTFITYSPVLNYVMSERNLPRGIFRGVNY